MFFYVISLLVVFCASNVLSDTEPCKLSEPTCLDKITVKAYPKYIEGDSQLKMESLDPMHHNHIDMKTPNLFYEITNVDVVGLKDCKMENVTLSPELRLHFDLACPKIFLSGKYNISGKIIGMPVQGDGDYIVKTKRYRISVDADLSLVQGKDGKTHLSVKDFQQTSKPLDPVNYDFHNLFGGNVKLADAVLKFADENWQAISKLGDSPVFTAHLKKIFKNANKYLKTVPIEK